MFKRLRMWDRALMPGRDDACDYNEKLFDVLKDDAIKIPRAT